MKGKLYFKYGTMGSSKTAQALITDFNYKENGMTTLLIKPQIDTRVGDDIIMSRIGLFANSDLNVSCSDNIFKKFKDIEQKPNVVIVDEAQFLTAPQIDQLRQIADDYNIPVYCYGLRTDFTTHLFEGSKRLFEIADKIEEIQARCKCGGKAIINAKIDGNGKVVTNGEIIDIGGNEKYVAMCHKCYIRNVNLRYFYVTKDNVNEFVKYANLNNGKGYDEIKICENEAILKCKGLECDRVSLNKFYVREKSMFWDVYYWSAYTKEEFLKEFHILPE